MVRIHDAEEKALAPRIHRQWTVKKLASVMVSALEKQNTKVPEYLTLLATESAASTRGARTAIFGMG